MQITNEQRLQDYFWKLELMFPNPGPDWARSVKPCKYAKILKERKRLLENGREKETGPVCQHQCQA